MNLNTEESSMRYRIGIVAIGLLIVVTMSWCCPGGENLMRLIASKLERIRRPDIGEFFYVRESRYYCEVGFAERTT